MAKTWATKCCSGTYKNNYQLCCGIKVYLTEFYKYLGNRASFFVPDDIEIKLKNGNATLYDRQYARFCHLVPEDVRLIPLVEMIHRYHRVYEQEGYISSIVFR